MVQLREGLRLHRRGPRDEPERRPDEDQVEVTLTRGFWMGQFEVTQGQKGPQADAVRAVST